MSHAAQMSNVSNGKSVYTQIKHPATYASRCATDGRGEPHVLLSMDDRAVPGGHCLPLGTVQDSLNPGLVLC